MLAEWIHAQLFRGARKSHCRRDGFRVSVDYRERCFPANRDVETIAAGRRRNCSDRSVEAHALHRLEISRSDSNQPRPASEVESIPDLRARLVRKQRHSRSLDYVLARWPNEPEMCLVALFSGEEKEPVGLRNNPRPRGRGMKLPSTSG